MLEIDGAWDISLAPRLEKGFRYLTGRRPNPEELTVLQDLSRSNYAAFLENRDNSVSFLQYGEAGIDERLNKTELAALAFTASAIMNLDETITRD